MKHASQDFFSEEYPELKLLQVGPGTRRRTEGKHDCCLNLNLLRKCANLPARLRRYNYWTTRPLLKDRDAVRKLIDNAF